MQLQPKSVNAMMRDVMELMAAGTAPRGVRPRHLAMLYTMFAFMEEREYLKTGKCSIAMRRETLRSLLGQNGVHSISLCVRDLRLMGLIEIADAPPPGRDGARGIMHMYTFTKPQPRETRKHSARAPRVDKADSRTLADVA